MKQDLLNLSVQLRKSARDHDRLQLEQQEISSRVDQLARQYLQDQVDWVSSKLTPSNFSSSKSKLLKAVDRCKSIGFAIADAEAHELVSQLQVQYEEVLRKDFERQEQARIRAQIREEQKVERELQKHIDDAEREKATIALALEKALRDAQDEHAAEVEFLQARLREAEEKVARAVSQAQLTKAGYVYVISNIGSFGEGVFKIGMTRRLEPLERVKELGDASVPFPFDIHMMISSDNAPALESALHKELHLHRLNKVNFRKEYFRVDLKTICESVERNHGTVDYIASPTAWSTTKPFRCLRKIMSFSNEPSIPCRNPDWDTRMTDPQPFRGLKAGNETCRNCTSLFC